MKLSAIASRIRMDIRHFGVIRTAFQLLMKGIQLCIDFRIMRVSKKETVDPEYLESDDRFQWQFLDESQLHELARNPDCALTENFVQTALEKGDDCYGALDGDVLACCSWYSQKPTDDMGLTVHFSPDYLYSHAAFTHPKYRGQRLFAVRGNRAARELLGRGFRGYIFTTDSHNFRALRASSKLGVELVGYIVLLKFGNHLCTYTSRGCRRHGFFLSKPSVVRELAPTA